MIFTLERTHYCFTKMGLEAVLSGIFYVLPKCLPKSLHQLLSVSFVLLLSFFSQYLKWFVQVRKQNGNETYELNKK